MSEWGPVGVRTVYRDRTEFGVLRGGLSKQATFDPTENHARQSTTEDSGSSVQVLVKSGFSKNPAKSV